MPTKGTIFGDKPKPEFEVVGVELDLSEEDDEDEADSLSLVVNDVSVLNEPFVGSCLHSFLSVLIDELDVEGVSLFIEIFSFNAGSFDVFGFSSVCLRIAESVSEFKSWLFVVLL